MRTNRNYFEILVAVTLLSGCAAHAEQEETTAHAAQALGSSSVFGFEDISLWTVSSGTKQPLTDASQGSTALGVASTYYAEITSSVIDAVGSVSSNLALDVKLPTTAGWGDLRIIVSVPSQSIYYDDLGAIALDSLGAGTYQTVHFQVPSRVVDALQANPSDATFKIIYNGQIGASPVAFDNLRFVTGTQPPSVVEIRTPLVDDYAYLVVNGIRHRIGYWGQDSNEAQSWRDVSAWFVGGANDVRLQVINGGGPLGVDFEMRVDGNLVADIECSGTSCGAETNRVFVDQTLSLPALNLPAARTVTITSPTSGKLYLDDEFTGLTTPTTLSLPVGEYVLGLGVGSDAPFSLSGSYHEETVVVGSSDVSVTLGDEPALGTVYQPKIAILPVRRARALDSDGLAILSDAEVARFAGQFETTNQAWVKPLSYGLHSWDITVLPVEEELEISSPNFEEFPDHACGDIVYTNKYSNLLDTYDVVVVHMSNWDAAQGITIGRGASGMAGRCGQIQASWSAGLASDAPSPVILHELLHSYESFQTDALHQTAGIAGLHGGEEHGFQKTGAQGEQEWLEWDRYFMRGQAPETTTMVDGVELSAPPLQPDYYVGAFRAVRRGLWHKH